MSVLSQVLDYLGPRPGLAIIRVHQGKVEVIIRIVLIAFVFFAFICAAFLLTHLKATAPLPLPDGDGADVIKEFAATRPGCKWLIFACWMAILVQGFALALRFLNLELVEKYIGFVLIGSLVIHGVFLVSWFAGAINFAVRSAHWQRLHKLYDSKTGNKTVIDNVPFSVIMSASSATCSFVFLSLLTEIILTIWIVAWLVLRWQQLVTQHLRYKPAGPTKVANEDDGKEWETEED